MPWVLLVLAISSEVFGTVMLKASEGFSRWLPVAGVVVGYGLSFLFLGLALKDIGVGVAYAIWSGLAPSASSSPATSCSGSSSTRGATSVSQ